MVLDVYTISEVAQKIGCDHGRVLTWVLRGKLAYLKKIGTQYVLPSDAVENAKKLRDGIGLQPKPQHLFERIGVDEPGYVSKADAADAIGVRQETLMRWVADGQLRAFKRHGRERVLFAQADVDRLAAGRAGRAA